MVAKYNETDTMPGQEFSTSHIFEAPINRVFEAWMDSKRVAQWWGPNGFTNPVCEINAWPGGSIRIDMRGPDGTVYPMSGVFKEIIKPETIVFGSSALDRDGRPIFDVVNTIAFADKDGKTELSVHASVFNATPAAAPYLQEQEEGWAQTLGRLEAFLKG